MWWRHWARKEVGRLPLKKKSPLTYRTDTKTVFQHVPEVSLATPADSLWSAQYAERDNPAILPPPAQGFNQGLVFGKRVELSGPARLDDLTRVRRPSQNSDPRSDGPLHLLTSTCLLLNAFQCNIRSLSFAGVLMSRSKSIGWDDESDNSLSKTLQLICQFLEKKEISIIIIKKCNEWRKEWRKERKK